MIRFFSLLRLLLLAAFAVTIVAGFILVPPGTMLPVHWNMAGEADWFLPREVALVVPACAAALAWGIFLVIDRVAQPAERRAGAYVTGVVLTAVTAMFLAITVATIAIGMGTPVDMVQVVAVAVAVLLLVLGNAMPKSRPNSFAGIRIPTTLRSEANWQQTHRLGGWIMLAGGAILLVAAFTVPANVLVWWVVGCTLVPVLIAAGYSLVIARHS